jgi:hypothetical protein
MQIVFIRAHIWKEEKIRFLNMIPKTKPVWKRIGLHHKRIFNNVGALHCLDLLFMIIVVFALVFILLEKKHLISGIANNDRNEF